MVEQREETAVYLLLEEIIRMKNGWVSSQSKFLTNILYQFRTGFYQYFEQSGPFTKVQLEQSPIFFVKSYYSKLETHKSQQMSESYFFALAPEWFGVPSKSNEDFVSGAKYRLAIFKGIQKCDQMKEGIVVNQYIYGRVKFQNILLCFNVPYFSPTKNIQFTIRVYQQNPKQNQAEVAAYTFGSTDYIRQFKANQVTSFDVRGQHQQDRFIDFKLFVHKSKQLLDQLFSQQVSPKFTKQTPNDNASQQSKQLVREGQGFLSPKRRLERRRGNEGRLRSRSRSQDKSQTLLSSPRSIPKSTTSAKNIANPADTKVSVKDEKTYQYQPPTKLNYTDTKEIFDIKIGRGNSPVRSPRDAQNSVKSPPQTRTSFISPSQQNIPQTTTQPATNVFSRTNVTSPAQSKTSVLSTTPKSQTTLTSGLEIKHNSKVFDIVPRQNVTSPKSQQPKSPGKYEPKREPKVIETQNQFPIVKINQVQPKGFGQAKNQGTLLLGGNLQAPSFETMTESTIVITVEGQVNEPKAVIIGEEEDIQVKAKPVTKKEGVHQRLSEAAHSQVLEAQAHKSEKSLEERKYELLYGLFLVASVFLIYFAMCPTRRV